MTACTVLSIPTGSGEATRASTALKSHAKEDRTHKVKGRAVLASGMELRADLNAAERASARSESKRKGETERESVSRSTRKRNERG
eukprot:859943-Pleurochrysis_carterae.AAC.1